jgi:hypothetical protein
MNRFHTREPFALSVMLTKTRRRERSKRALCKTRLGRRSTIAKNGKETKKSEERNVKVKRKNAHAKNRRIKKADVYSYRGLAVENEEPPAEIFYAKLCKASEHGKIE